MLDISDAGGKKEVAKVEDPTGWPRRGKPEVSLMGYGGACLSVGWGVVENWAILLERERAIEGSWAESQGRINDSSQEVRMHVFDGLTKQPIEAPRDLSCWHKKSKSGR